MTDLPLRVKVQTKPSVSKAVSVWHCELRNTNIVVLFLLGVRRVRLLGFSMKKCYYQDLSSCMSSMI